MARDDHVERLIFRRQVNAAVFAATRVMGQIGNIGRTGRLGIALGDFNVTVDSIVGDDVITVTRQQQRHAAMTTTDVHDLRGWPQLATDEVKVRLFTVPHTDGRTPRVIVAFLNLGESIVPVVGVGPAGYSVQPCLVAPSWRQVHQIRSLIASNDVTAGPMQRLLLAALGQQRSKARASSAEVGLGNRHTHAPLLLAGKTRT